MTVWILVGNGFNLSITDTIFQTPTPFMGNSSNDWRQKQSNITTFNYVCRLIVNRIIEVEFILTFLNKHANINCVR